MLIIGISWKYNNGNSTVMHCTCVHVSLQAWRSTGIKEQPRTKIGLAEKDVKSNGQPMPPSFDRFESCGHDELTVKHCYFSCSKPPDVDGIKMFDKDDQAAKHYFQCLWLGHLYQKF